MTDTKELNDALASNFLLCSLQIRSWTGRRTDKAASAEMIEAKGAHKESGAFVKNLLANAGAELKAVQQQGAALRHFLYARTLPWTSNSEGVSRGDRLLASAQAMDFLQEFKGQKLEYDSAVKELVGVWDIRVGEAMKNLGMLSDAGDYPSKEELPKMFAVSIDIAPMPAMADFSRLNVPSALATALGNRHASSAQLQVQNAMNDMKDRMLGELERINTQMSKHANGEKTRLYESLITNMQGLVQLTRTMNLTNNPRLTELAERIEQKLLAHPVSVYKDNPSKAAVLASDARDLAVDAALEEIWK